jgi:uncharacterized membrane protein
VSLVTAILLWLHIFSAVGWLGSVMVFGMLVSPLLPGFSVSTRAELVVKLFPRYVRYLEAFTLTTVVFGAAAALALANGNMAVFAPTSNFGLFISVGALLALIALVNAFAVAVPATNKVVRLTAEMMKNPGPPPPELQKASSRLRVSASFGMVILIIVLVCMVAAAS